jgi:hypothetical protein
VSSQHIVGQHNTKWKIKPIGEKLPQITI